MCHGLKSHHADARTTTPHGNGSVDDDVFIPSLALDSTQLYSTQLKSFENIQKQMPLRAL